MATDRSLRFVVPDGGTEEAHFALESQPGAALAAAPGGGDAPAGGPGVSSSPSPPPGQAAEKTTPSGGSAADATRWYVATISTWFFTVSGCFFWWRFNLRQLRRQA